MRKLVKFAGLLLLCFVLFFTISLVKDKKTLQDNLIRLHVVANSDSTLDQAQKLAVKDAVVAYLSPAMNHLDSMDEAKQYLSGKLGEIEQLANDTLKREGSAHKAAVRLDREKFGTRVYDTFSLPAGIYESLRIEIGNAEGKNWWCVVFPTLCAPATTEGFSAKAVNAGFDSTLTAAISGEEPYEIRFFLLDCIGRLENFFSRS